MYNSPMQNVTSRQPRCASWDFDLKRMNSVLYCYCIINLNHCSNCYTEWTTEGCETVEVNRGIVTCNCTHLTNFAILVVSTNCVAYRLYVLRIRMARSVIHLTSRISAQGFRTVNCLYMHHWQHSPLLEWSFPSLALLPPLSPCFCSSEC